MNNINRKRKIKKIVFLSWLCLATPLHGADIKVSIEEPIWEFLLPAKANGETRARLRPDEADFARSIQALLADENYAAAAAEFDSRPLETDSASLRQLRGQILLQLGRNGDSQAALESALELSPDLVIAHRTLAMIHMLESDFENARGHLRQTIELGGADAQAYGQLGFVNLQLSHPASAIAGYQHAMFLDPDNEQWQRGLLHALMSSHAYDQALMMIDQRLTDNINDKSLWLQRSQIALQKQRPVQALSSLETAFKLGEKNLANIASAALVHIEHGSPRRAVDLIVDNMSKFASATNRSNIEVLDQVAAWLAYEQQWNNLNRLLTGVASAKFDLPSKITANFDVYRAQILLSKDQRRPAREALERAINSDPSNGEALLSLAELLVEDGIAERALLYYVRAEALELFRERALLGHAQLEIDRQNYAEALRVMQQVAQLLPNRSDIKSNIQTLENLVKNQG